MHIAYNCSGGSVVTNVRTLKPTFEVLRTGK